MAKPSAEALLRVESAATDGTGMKIVQESTMLELDTAPMYNAAAQESGTTPATCEYVRRSPRSPTRS